MMDGVLILMMVFLVLATHAHAHALSLWRLSALAHGAWHMFGIFFFDFFCSRRRSS